MKKILSASKALVKIF